MAHELPEFVYLITVSSEWPVSAIADDHPTTPEAIEREVNRRAQSGNVYDPGSQIRIWKVRVQDAQQVELLPTATVRAQLRESTS